jgi:hypothetical protein
VDTSATQRGQKSRKPSPAPLRIGLLIDRRDGLENWQLALIDRILADDRFQLQAILVCPAKPDAASLLFRMAASLERVALGRQPRYHPKSHFADLPWKAHEGESDQNHQDELDLVLALSPSSMPLDGFSKCPFGLWRFSFLNQATAKADWFGYQEVMGAKPATELRIEVYRSDQSGETLATAAFNTKFSAVRNRDFIKERAVTLVMRELRKLADTRTLNVLTAATPAQAADMPSGRQLLSYAAALGRSLLGRARQAVISRLGLGAPAWALFVGNGRPEDFDPQTAVLLKPEDDELRADPFLFQHDGQMFVFYEAYTPRDSKAHIAVGRLEGDSLTPLGIALTAAHHLSYPFVFRHNGEIFMIPETNQARRLEVWRSVAFPLSWELHATALEGQSSADSALIPFGGKWWLFTNLSEFHAYEDHCSELHIFEVDGPDLKSIKPHRGNPVVVGSTEARNGGRPFEHAGRLYRPSQRNEHGIYGYGLNIMEIEELDRETYRERCLRTIEPDFAPDIIACHHLDAAGGRYIIDAMFADQANLFR